MKEEKKNIKKDGVEIFLRYSVGVIVAVLAVTFSIFYVVFRPLTVWLVYSFLKIFYEVNLIGISSIVVANYEIELIDACIAGSAYLLLFLLNIATRGMALKKRAFVFIFGSAALLLINVLRVIILITMLVNNSIAFDLTHKLFWYVMSTFFVVVVWFFSVWLFKLKAIPFYSDIKFILERKD
ncbi:MAG: pacearchaeosortase [Candidatus Pacearchaeota archaeon]|nr:pacearchaeosortase [Candidatus Pacearchaeota archaeon]